MQLKFFILFSLTTQLWASVPALLSETGLYENTLKKKINAQNMHYSPQYPLWSDGAAKDRWTYLPPKTKINIADDWDHWTFPIGTKLWKEFKFKGKRVETRFMQKSNETDWDFATYLWNENETEAQLAPEDGINDYYPIQNGIQHDIPSVPNCIKCHQRGGDAVLGFEAIQLSTDRDPNALHTEPFTSDMITIKDLVERNLIEPKELIKTTAPKIPSQTALGKTALGYLHTNCGSCHNSQGSSKHISMNLRYDSSAETENKLPTFVSSVNKQTQILNIPYEEKTYRIVPSQPEKSAIAYFMKKEGTSHMPNIGSKIIDKKAIILIQKWIQSLSAEK